MSIDYQYYNDGTLSYSHDVLDPRFDRSYARDHAGRLRRGHSGAEARGEAATTDRPYWQNYGYDAFDHLTSRTTKHWSKSQAYISGDSYSNNRRVDWQYDAAGNLTDNLAIQYSYDAAGRMSFVSSGTLNQFFDGDGQRVKSTEPSDVTYYVRSTVLKGQVIAELDGAGARRRGFIYAGGALLAEWQNGSVAFTHKDPSGTSVRDGSGAHELDPMGADTELSDPYLADPGYDGREPGGPLFPGYGNITRPSTGCTLDGVYALCEWVDRGMGNGSVDALLRFASGKTRQVPIQNYGFGLYWIPGQHIDLHHSDESDEDVVRVYTDYLQGFFLPLPQNPQLPRPNTTTVSLPNPQLSQINSASQIAENILSGNNPCSQFFQGSTGAIAALGALNSVLEPRLFMGRPGLGISMTFNLPYTLATSGGTTYRLPSSALVNTQGIFYFGSTFVGSFSSNSTAGQVLQILHEVAHLVRQPNGNWLIFNDGTSATISKANTGVVAAKCTDTIKAALGIRPITVNIGPPPR
jgi:hypothetical protein